MQSSKTQSQFSISVDVETICLYHVRRQNVFPSELHNNNNEQQQRQQQQQKSPQGCYSLKWAIRRGSSRKGCLFALAVVLVARAHDPFGLRQGSSPLAGSNTASPQFAYSLSNLTNLIRYKYKTSTLYAGSKIGSGQRSRSLAQTKRIVGPGDENAIVV